MSKHASSSMNTSYAYSNAQSDSPRTVLLLLVDNHPHVMAQVSGLCARRGYCLTSMICLPDVNGQRQIWLELNDIKLMPQVIRQLQKLHDVQSARLITNASVFLDTIEKLATKSIDDWG
ncbi:MAG: ACT domain-containing protein [Deltaproteobacteria bacterium]|nr:ACT domain-containing protein [Deltaproteobacteria bacterium]